jgi:hypothetical protein
MLFCVLLFSKILNLIKPVKKKKKKKLQGGIRSGNLSDILIQDHEINYTMAKRRIDDDPDKNI